MKPAILVTQDPGRDTWINRRTTARALAFMGYNKFARPLMRCMSRFWQCAPKPCEKVVMFRQRLGRSASKSGSIGQDRSFASQLSFVAPLSTISAKAHRGERCFAPVTTIPIWIAFQLSATSWYRRVPAGSMSQLATCLSVSKCSRVKTNGHACLGRTGDSPLDLRVHRAERVAALSISDWTGNSRIWFRCA